MFFSLFQVTEIISLWCQRERWLLGSWQYRQSGVCSTFRDQLPNIWKVQQIIFSPPEAKSQRFLKIKGVKMGRTWDLWMSFAQSSLGDQWRSPPMVLSWYSWNWPLTKRSTKLDFPTADSPSSTSLNWQILLLAAVPLVRCAPPRPAMAQHWRCRMRKDECGALEAWRLAAEAGRAEWGRARWPQVQFRFADRKSWGLTSGSWKIRHLSVFVWNNRLKCLLVNFSTLSFKVFPCWHHTLHHEGAASIESSSS